MLGFCRKKWGTFKKWIVWTFNVGQLGSFKYMNVISVQRKQQQLRNRIARTRLDPMNAPIYVFADPR